MKIIFYFISTFLTLSMAVAASDKKKKIESDARKPSQVNVYTFDPSYPTENLEKNGYQTYGASQKMPQSQEVMSGQKRDELYRKIGLAELVKSWDELQKDLLFLRAKHSSNLEQLKTSYPQIKESILSELMKYAKP